MRLFVRNVLGLACLFIISFSLIVLINFILVNSGKLLPESDKNILILGDSNTECAINDSIFNSSVNWSSGGEPYFYSYLKLKHIIKSKSNIDTVFLSFSPHNVFEDGWLPDNRINSHLKLYLPLMSLDDFTFLFSRKPIGVLSSFPKIIKKAIVNAAHSLIGKEILPSDYGGFHSLERNILEEVLGKLKNGEPLPFFTIPDNFSISGNQLAYLDEIILLCNKHDLTLFLINTPKRNELLSYPKYGCKEFYRLYDEKYPGINFLDFSNINLPDDFHGDLVHLSSKGSDYFSSFLEEKGMAHIVERFNRHAVQQTRPAEKVSLSTP